MLSSPNWKFSLLSNLQTLPLNLSSSKVHLLIRFVTRQTKHHSQALRGRDHPSDGGNFVTDNYSWQIIVCCSDCNSTDVYVLTTCLLRKTSKYNFIVKMSLFQNILKFAFFTPGNVLHFRTLYFRNHFGIVKIPPKIFGSKSLKLIWWAAW